MDTGTLGQMGAQALAYLHPFWAGAWSAIRLASFLMAVILVFELCVPGRRLHWRTLAFNALYMPLYLTFAMALLYPLTVVVDPWLPKNLTGIQVSDRITPASLAFFALYLLCYDFFYYWFHRCQHAFGVMWRYHTLHHSDVNVSMSTSIRHHWLEESIRYFLIAAPMAVLYGGPGRIPFWMSAGTGLLGLVMHWNMPWRLSGLSRWVVTPWYHRIHHSVEPRHHQKNFAVFFPFWDRLFGTQHLPAEGEFPDTGIVGLQRPNGLALLLPWPLPTMSPTEPNSFAMVPDDRKGVWAGSP